MGRTLAEVEDKIRKLEDSLATGTVPQVGKMPTVREAFEHWLSTPSLRPPSPRTVIDYESRCRNWIFPHVGEWPIDALRPEHLDRMYTAMAEAECSPSHIHKTHAVVRRGLKIACRRRGISNPTSLMDAPGSPGRSEIEPLTRKEARKVLAVAQRRDDPARWILRLTTGQRQGEVLGLTWERLDLTEKIADFSFQLQRLPWRHGCGDAHACGERRGMVSRKGAPLPSLHRYDPCPPSWEHGCDGRCTSEGNPRWCPQRRRVKCRRHTRACPPPCRRDCTGHAAQCPQRLDGGLVIRPRKGVHLRADGGGAYVVPLVPELATELRKHRVRQAGARLRAGNQWVENDLVFCDEVGRPIDPRRDWAEWRELLQEARVREARLHDARHTAATTMLELGVDLAIVQQVLGHSDSRTTRRYTHVSTTLARSATKRVGAALLGRPSSKTSSNDMR
ncbi:site-specific integrase [Actinocatenispora sera]|uniref:tyrosine-type recombinase/integrase n=1 Tax=Actinocatenispora sera TaxID=390989 RepID=UPI00340F493B